MKKRQDYKGYKIILQRYPVTQQKLQLGEGC
jgi:hypothetical protein